jgi:hypothetical protein
MKIVQYYANVKFSIVYIYYRVQKRSQPITSLDAMCYVTLKYENQRVGLESNINRSILALAFDMTWVLKTKIETIL